LAVEEKLFLFLFHTFDIDDVTSMSTQIAEEPQIHRLLEAAQPSPGRVKKGDETTLRNEPSKGAA
jgi:hypothetical protein